MKRGKWLAKAAGAQFQKDISDSCNKANIYLVRLRDVFIPPELRHLIDLPESPYDYIICNSGIVIPAELKSTQLKSLSFKMIKDHQIKALSSDVKYESIYPGFIFNFRECDNETYYIHIKDFLLYQQVAAGEIASPYKGKVNKASMGVDICREIGIKIDNEKLRVHYRYDIKKLIEDVKVKYENN